jgi:hypothetical protein
MTTTAITLDGAPDSGSAVGAYQHLAALLPKLAQPWWYKHAHSGRWTDEKERQAKDAATKKAERREARKADRLTRALAGEHTCLRPIADLLIAEARERAC